MKKSRIYLSFSCFIAFYLIFVLNSTNVFAKDTEEDIYILFNGDIPSSGEKKIKSKFPSISWEAIPEINFVKLSHVKSEKLVTQFIKEEFQIEDVGKGSRFESPVLNKDVIPLSLTKKNHTLSDAWSTYSDWSWDIQKVTNNYRSYDIEKGNHEVKVGIIDSGIDVTHPDLKGNIIGEGKSFIPGNPDVKDMLGHGTMVAGMIAANGKITGVGPQIGIVPYKVLNEDGGESSWVIKAIIEATNDNMDVINLSLNTFKSFKDKDDRIVINAYKKAVQYAVKNNTLVISSAGNEGFDISNPKSLAKDLGKPGDLQYMLPGGLDASITVGASTRDDEIASYSNYGKNVDITAPGGSFGPLWEEQQQADINYYIFSTYPTYLPQSPLNDYLGIDSGYSFSLGTSLSAPKVSATAALIIAEYEEKHHKKPDMSQVKKYLYQNSDKGKGNAKIRDSLDTYQSLRKVK